MKNWPDVLNPYLTVFRNVSQRAVPNFDLTREQWYELTQLLRTNLLHLWIVVYERTRFIVHQMKCNVEIATT